jgi:hypothetical protein
MNIKPISPEELETIFSNEWIPVELIGDAVPGIFVNMPSDIVGHVYASGTFNYPEGLPPGVPIPSGELFGGIDVYRNAPDDPVEFNKDWYPIVREAGTDRYFVITGYKPKEKSHEHWLNEIPQRLSGATVIGLQNKQK